MLPGIQDLAVAGGGFKFEFALARTASFISPTGTSIAEIQRAVPTQNAASALVTTYLAAMAGTAWFCGIQRIR